jgi:hypothetical protein
MSARQRAGSLALSSGAQTAAVESSNPVAWRLFHLRRRLAGLRAEWIAARHHPEFIAAMRTIGSMGGRESAAQLQRALELTRLLEAARPVRIAECGSGLSTIVFACYAQRSGASVFTLEESRRWADATRAGAGAAHIRLGELSLAPVIAAGAGDRCYETALPRDADFIYVDGPAADGFVQKGACVDVLRLLDSGARPELIVIDGRFATVQRLQAHSAAGEYQFVPSTHYQLAARGGAPFRSYVRHSVFRRQQAPH